MLGPPTALPTIAMFFNNISRNPLLYIFTAQFASEKE
jgi:hypothetical protein